MTRYDSQKNEGMLFATFDELVFGRLQKLLHHGIHHLFQRLFGLLKITEIDIESSIGLQFSTIIAAKRIGLEKQCTWFQVEYAAPYRI